jgi:AcrR family transcriptional regulator
MSKLLAIDIETAFKRAVSGESVRKIAKGLRVTEGALRYHFGKGASPKEARQLAFRLYELSRQRARMNAAERELLDRLVRKGKKQ